MNSNMFWEHNVKCEFCETSFDSQETLKHHLRLHSRRKPYDCLECGAKFSYNSTLEWHKKSHSGEMPFRCQECGAQFIQNSMLVWHKRKHRLADSSHKPSLVVNMDNFYQQGTQNFSNVLNLPGMITNSGTSANISIVSVSQCDSASVSAPDMKSNGTIAGLTNLPESCGILYNGSSKRKADSETRTYCDICGMMFMQVAVLKSHMETKHNMGDNNPFHALAKQQETNGQFVSRKKVIVEKRFKCDLCGAGFNTEGHLRSHRQKHTEERPYKCEKCGISFSEKVVLESHEQRHQTERPYKCGQCGASFFRESHLQRHHKRHTGELN